MAEYCSETDVKNRLTERGFKFAVDRDRDGSASAAEKDAYLTTAVRYASNLIDGSVSGFMEPSDARQSGNAWLKDRAVDIAAYRVATHGGSRPPGTLKQDYDDARELLKSVKNGSLRVPELKWPVPRGTCGRTAMMPVAINP